MSLLKRFIRTVPQVTLAGLLANPTITSAQVEEPEFEGTIPGQVSWRLAPQGDIQTNLIEEIVPTREGDIDVVTIDLDPQTKYSLAIDLAKNRSPTGTRGLGGYIDFFNAEGKKTRTTIDGSQPRRAISIDVPKDAKRYEVQAEIHEVNAQGEDSVIDIDFLQGKIRTAEEKRGEIIARMQEEREFHLKVAKKTSAGAFITVDLEAGSNPNQKIVTINPQETILLYSPEFRNNPEAHFRDDAQAEPIIIRKGEVTVGKKIVIGDVNENLEAGNVSYSWKKPVPEGFETNDVIEVAFPESGQYRINANLQLRGEFGENTEFEDDILSVIVGGELTQEDKGYHLVATINGERQEITQQDSRVGDLEVKVGNVLALSIEKGNKYQITKVLQIDPRGVIIESQAPTQKIDVPTMAQEGTWRFEITYQAPGEKPDTDIVNVAIKKEEPEIIAAFKEHQQQKDQSSSDAIPSNTIVYTQPTPEMVADATREIEANGGRLPEQQGEPKEFQPKQEAEPLPPPPLDTIINEFTHDTGYNLEARVNGKARVITNETLEGQIYPRDMLKISCVKETTRKTLDRRMQYPNGTKANIHEEVFEIPVVGDYIAKVDCLNTGDMLERETLRFTVEKKSQAPVLASPAPVPQPAAPVVGAPSTSQPSVLLTQAPQDAFHGLHDTKVSFEVDYLNTTLTQDGERQSVQGARSRLFLNPAATLGANGPSVGAFWKYEKTRLRFTEGFEGEMQEDQQAVGVTLAGHDPATVELEVGYSWARDQANIMLGDQGVRFNQRKRGLQAKLDLSAVVDAGQDVQLKPYSRTELDVLSREYVQESSSPRERNIVSGDSQPRPLAEEFREGKNPKVRLQEYVGTEVDTGIINPYAAFRIQTGPQNETKNTGGLGFEAGVSGEIAKTPLGPFYLRGGFDVLLPLSEQTREREFFVQASAGTDYLRGTLHCGQNVTLQGHQEQTAVVCGASIDIFGDAPYETERR